MSSRTSYARGVSWGAISFATMAAVGVFTGIAIARVYGATVLGEYALVQAPVTAVWFISSVREQAALVRKLSLLQPRDPHVTALFAVVFAFSTVLTVVVAAIGLVITYLVFRGPVGRPELFVPAAVNMLGYIVFTNSGWNLDMVFSGFRAGKELSWVRLTQAWSFLAIVIPVGLIRGSVWVFVIATIASYALSLAHRLVSIRRYMRYTVSREELRKAAQELPDMLRFGVRAAPGWIADGLSQEAGTWVLGSLGSLSAVGAYNRAWQLGSRFLDLNRRITEMLFPTLVERREGGDIEGHDRVLVDSMRYSAVGMLLPAAAGGGAAVGVMSLFGPGFDSAATALTLLLLIPALSSVNGIQGHGLLAADRPLRASVGSLLRMFVTFGLTVPLAHWLGISGVALALVLGFLVHSLWLGAQMRAHLKLPLRRYWPVRQMLPIVLAYAVGYLVARVIDRSIPNLGGLALALCAGSIAYAVVFVVTGGTNARDRARLGDALDRLSRRRDTRSQAAAPHLDEAKRPEPAQTRG